LEILFHRTTQAHYLKNLHLAKATSKRLTSTHNWRLPTIHYLEKPKPKRFTADINKTAGNIKLCYCLLKLEITVLYLACITRKNILQNSVALCRPCHNTELLQPSSYRESTIIYQQLKKERQ